jgi:hypothetical protein
MKLEPSVLSGDGYILSSIPLPPSMKKWGLIAQSPFGEKYFSSDKKISKKTIYVTFIYIYC